MKWRAAAPAALALAGCAGTTELLPPESYCPTEIDVYGAADTLLSACGGPAAVPPSASGFFAPGTPDFDATLAGRLQAALTADAALAGRFDRPFHVRACGTHDAGLAALAPHAVSDECAGADAPPIAAGVEAACSESSAPLLLLLAAEPFDRCHGGGVDSERIDDEAGYARHFADRLDALLRARAPLLALVGAQTEWTPLPARGDLQEACGWRRADWNARGVARFRDAADAARRAALFFVADEHAAWKRHSARCCLALGVPCEAPDWLAAEAGGLPAPLSCEGAHRLVAVWLQALRSALSARRFSCEH